MSHDSVFLLQVLGVTVVGGVAIIALVDWWTGWLERQDNRLEERLRDRYRVPPTTKDPPP